MKVEPNHVYVIPPERGPGHPARASLHLMTPPIRAARPAPADRLLLPLARRGPGPRAIGIVLSGTGIDGTFGLQGDQGGGRHHVRPGPVDGEVRRHAAQRARQRLGGLLPAARRRSRTSWRTSASHPYLARAKPLAHPGAGRRVEAHRPRCAPRSAIDLSYYKPTTVERRIERRMALHKIERLDDYVQVRAGESRRAAPALQGHAHRRHEFFRDPERVRGAQDAVFPQPDRQQGRRRDHPHLGAGLRDRRRGVLARHRLLEYLDDRAPEYRIQIFGTDVDEEAIQHARAASTLRTSRRTSRRSGCTGSSSERDGDYQVARRVRDMVRVLAARTSLKDAAVLAPRPGELPQPAHLPAAGAAEELLRILHYALQPDGFLMLGTSETVGDVRTCSRSSTARTRSTREARVASRPRSTSASACRRRTSAADCPASARQRPASSLRPWPTARSSTCTGRRAWSSTRNWRSCTSAAHRALPRAVARRAPASTSCGWRAGAARRAATRDSQGQASNAASRVGRGPADRGRQDAGACDRGGAHPVEPETQSGVSWCCFTSRSRGAEHHGGTRPCRGGDGSPATKRAARSSSASWWSQGVPAEHDRGAGERQRGAQVVQRGAAVSNEELQSTNEELETSKEELQSTNEELTTVNDELQNRMVELQRPTTTCTTCSPASARRSSSSAWTCASDASRRPPRSAEPGAE